MMTTKSFMEAIALAGLSDFSGNMLLEHQKQNDCNTENSILKNA